MNVIKSRNSTRRTKVANHTKKTTLPDSRRKVRRNRNSQIPSTLIRNMTLDEMLEASSLFDSLINGASIVNQTSVSHKARELVKLTKNEYPNSVNVVYKALNKKIVATNRRMYSYDATSEELYTRLMSNKPIYVNDSETNPINSLCKVVIE